MIVGIAVVANTSIKYLSVMPLYELFEYDEIVQEMLKEAKKGGK